MTTENTTPNMKETVTANIENLNDNIESEKEHQSYCRSVRGSIKRSIKIMEGAEDGTTNPDGVLMGRNGYHTKNMADAITEMYVTLNDVEDSITESKKDLKSMKADVKAAEKYLNTIRD